MSKNIGVSNKVTRVEPKEEYKKEVEIEKLDEDGDFGIKSIEAGKKLLNVEPITGPISNQVYSMKKYFPGVSAVEWGIDSYGSTFVRKLQAKIGAYVDGKLGPNTALMLQKYLNQNGFKLEEDSIWGEKTSKALQKHINKELKLK